MDARQLSAKICMLLASSALFMGQATANEPDDVLFLENDDILFADLPSVFSASKYEQKITDAPARISIITSDEIKKYGHRTLAEVLSSVPGFQTRSDRSDTYIGSRGMGILGDYNTRQLVLINGHRLNDNVFNSVVVNDGFIVDIDLISRVEVVRGPASSVYGSSAFFGVINVITKKGRDIQGTELAVSAASFDTYRGRLSYGKRFDNGFEILLSGSGYDSKGDDEFYYPEFDDPATNNGIFEYGDDGDNHSLFGELDYQDLSLTAAYSILEKGIPTASYYGLFNDPRTRSWESSGYIDLKYQHLFGNGVELTSQAFYDKYRYDGDWAFDYAADGDPADEVVYKEIAEGTWWGAEALLTQKIHPQHKLTLGAEFTNSPQEKQVNYDIYDTYLDVNSDSRSWAVYLQDEFQLLDELILNLGIRYDDFSTVGGSTNPRIALIWSPLAQTSIKLLYGTAFRAPNAYELYFDDAGESHKAPVSLAPEAITSTELIIAQQFTPEMRLVASVFRNDIDDLIALTTDPDDQLLVFENIDSASSDGAEIELQGNWQAGYSGAVSYTYQNSQNNQGEWLTNSPRNLAKLNMTGPVFDTDINAGLELQYESGRKTRSGDKTDSRCLANLSLLNQSWIEGVEISATVYNLFDQVYAVPGSEEHIQDQLTQDGRTFRVKLGYAF